MVEMTSKRLQELQQRQAQLDAQIRKEQARLKTKVRKEDTRRKIIAGAVALTHCEKDAAFKRQFFALLDRFVESPTDRVLLGLADQAANKPADKAAETTPADTRSSNPSFIDKLQGQNQGR